MHLSHLSHLFATACGAAAPRPIRAAQYRTSWDPISRRSASRPAFFAVCATASCHSRTRPAIALSSRRDITRERPLSTSNASIQPADTPGSSNANDASTMPRNTSWSELRCAELAHQILDIVEQEVRDDRHHRRLAHEPRERCREVPAVPQVLQALAELVGIEAVNDLPLADARPQPLELA